MNIRPGYNKTCMIIFRAQGTGMQLVNCHMPSVTINTYCRSKWIVTYNEALGFGAIYRLVAQL
jgi:hypothetical protein